jgi:hypothetical protein
VGEQISGLRGVVSVCVVTGRFDLIVNLLLNEEFGLLEFYTQEMTKCSAEVMSTETFIVYKGYNLKLPYVFMKKARPADGSRKGAEMTTDLKTHPMHAWHMGRNANMAGFRRI